MYYQIPEDDKQVELKESLQDVYLAYPEFGRDISYDNFLNELLKFYKPTKSYMWNRQLIEEYYETKYGIHDFESPNVDPLASAEFHPKENYYKHSIYDNRLRVFLDLDVHAKTGLSFTEYLELSRPNLDAINRIVMEHHSRNQNLEKRAQQEAEAKHRKDEMSRKRSDGNNKLNFGLGLDK